MQKWDYALLGYYDSTDSTTRGWASREAGVFNADLAEAMTAMGAEGWEWVGNTGISTTWVGNPKPPSQVFKRQH